MTNIEPVSGATIILILDLLDLLDLLNGLPLVFDGNASLGQTVSYSRSMQESTSRGRKERNSSTPSRPWCTHTYIHTYIQSFDVSILMFSDFDFQVADFGGTLGVFIGFSFITVWDGMVLLAAAVAKIKIFFLN